MNWSVIGYGSFGSFFVEILKKCTQEKISVYTSKKNLSHTSKVDFSDDLEAVVHNADIIVPCVPIPVLKEVATDIAYCIDDDTTVLDVCSVKSYPKLIWSELLSDTTGLVLSHPMFGPASYAMNKYSTAGFTITLENISASTKHYAYLTDVFSNALSLNVVEMSAEEHDKKAAIFHGTAQYLANLLRRLEIETSAIDTYSYRKLIAFRDAISTDERFLSELMEYNPFLPEIIADIHSTEDALYKSLTDRSEE